jgi:cytochrome c2
MRQPAQLRLEHQKGASMRITLLLAGLVLAAAPGLARADDAKPWEGGDVTAGKQVFVKCSLCHYAEPGKVKIGPPLWGVVGRPSGSVPGYNYSTAMKSYNHVWTPENLFVYLQQPMKVVVGTKMAFVGLQSPTDRANVIAYLETLK